jgi:holo-[acyl-carrier protein] synthase
MKRINGLSKHSRITIGVDIIEIDRIEEAISNWQKSFLERVYTESEVAICQNIAASFAARFAAKEAVMKALGTGMRGIKWRDIEITQHPSGAPDVKLYGSARNKARELGITNLSLSLSHSKKYAVAMVVGDAI